MAPKFKSSYNPCTQGKAPQPQSLCSPGAIDPSPEPTPVLMQLVGLRAQDQAVEIRMDDIDMRINELENRIAHLEKTLGL
jgi:hypothetical protein